MAVDPVPLEAQYKTELEQLLPEGALWPKPYPASSTLGAFLDGLAAELARVHARTLDFIDESDPALTSELLEQWEASVGLPDGCADGYLTVLQRRAAVLARITSRGGGSKAFFVALAADLGYPITIEEFRPFRCGMSRCGDRLYSTPAGWRAAWRVHAPQKVPSYFYAGESACGEPLSSWGDELLQCIFQKLKPAHSILLFAFDLVFTGYAPWGMYVTPSAPTLQLTPLKPTIVI